MLSLALYSALTWSYHGKDFGRSQASVGRFGSTASRGMFYRNAL